MPLNSFRQVFLPYCIQRHPDGTFSIMNRERHDLGYPGPIYVEGSEPRQYEFEGVGPATLDRIAIEPGQNGWWYLYDDGTLPDSSKEAWEAYSARLWQLRKFEFIRS